MAKSGWYTVYVKNIYIRTTGGQSANNAGHDSNRIIKARLDVRKLNSGKGVIVDSGTTDTYLSKLASREFIRAWKRVTGRTVYNHEPLALTPEQLHALPTVLIQCQSYSFDDDPSIAEYDNIPGYTGSLDPDSPRDLLIAIPATR